MQMQNEFDEIQNGEHGKLSIGVHLWKSSFMLPDILPLFIKKYPNIEIQLHEGGPQVLTLLPLNNTIDFCIMNIISYDKRITWLFLKLGVHRFLGLSLQYGKMKLILPRLPEPLSLSPKIYIQNEPAQKAGYEVILAFKISKLIQDLFANLFHAGKPKMVATIFGLNKFLRFYFAKVMELSTI